MFGHSVRRGRGRPQAIVRLASVEVLLQAVHEATEGHAECGGWDKLITRAWNMPMSAAKPISACSMSTWLDYNCKPIRFISPVLHLVLEAADREGPLQVGCCLA